MQFVLLRLQIITKCTKTVFANEIRSVFIFKNFAELRNNKPRKQLGRQIWFGNQTDCTRFSEDYKIRGIIITRYYLNKL
jgi:hypothetical protein